MKQTDGKKKLKSILSACCVVNDKLTAVCKMKHYTETVFVQVTILVSQGSHGLDDDDFFI